MSLSSRARASGARNLLFAGKGGKQIPRCAPNDNNANKGLSRTLLQSCHSCFNLPQQVTLLVMTNLKTVTVFATLDKSLNAKLLDTVANGQYLADRGSSTGRSVTALT